MSIGKMSIDGPVPAYSRGGIVPTNNTNALAYANGVFTGYSQVDYAAMKTYFKDHWDEYAFAPDYPVEKPKPAVHIPDFVGPRPLYRQEDLNLNLNWKELEDEAKTARPDEVDTPEDANLIGSKADILEPDGHLPVIDMDLPCHLEPSTTPGHFHLYVNKVVAWDKYVAVLKAMYEAGLVEEGFYEMTVSRGESFVRPPWVAKLPGEGSSD